MCRGMRAAFATQADLVADLRQAGRSPRRLRLLGVLPGGCARRQWELDSDSAGAGPPVARSALDARRRRVTAHLGAVMVHSPRARSRLDIERVPRCGPTGGSIATRESQLNLV